jgi:hypothetical protein
MLHKFVLPTLVVALGCLLVGCGHKSKSTAELDVSELVELIQGQNAGELRNYLELDMGKFRVTHPLEGGEGQILVEFHLYGILPVQRKARLEQRLPQFEKRVRDAIISLVQRTATQHLTDPSLALFKTEVVAVVNRILEDRLLHDVAFSDYSIERG